MNYSHYPDHEPSGHQYPGPSYPAMGGPPPKKPSPWSSPAVLVAVIAGLILLAGGIVAAVVYSTGTDTVGAPATSSTAAPATVTLTEPGAPPTHTVTAAPPPPVTQTPLTQAPVTRGSGPVTVSGADRQGFRSGPRCNAAEDDAVFIGYTSRSHVVICQVGSQTGRYYYKGEAGGDTIEIGYPTRSGDSFVATNGNTEYLVTPSSLTIRSNGATLASEPMIASWVD